MQSTQDWQGENLAFLVIQRNRLSRPFWNLLPDALMRPGLVEVLDVGTQDTMQLLLLQDEQVIEALSPHTALKAFTNRVIRSTVSKTHQRLDLVKAWDFRLSIEKNMCQNLCQSCNRGML